MLSPWVKLVLVLYSHLLIHAEIYIYILDTYRRNDNGRKKKGRRNEGRMKEDTGRLLYKYILPLTLFQGFERVVQGLHVRGSWRPNINFIFLTSTTYDRHVVSFLFS